MNGMADLADFSTCLRARGTPTFARELKAALLGLAPDTLPLQAGTTRGGLVDARDLAATVLTVHDHGDVIRARVGMHFTEIVGNCACGDAPYPAPAWCVLQVSIDTATARARFTVVPEE